MQWRWIFIFPNFRLRLNTMVRDGIKTAESNPELVTNLKIQSLWNMFEREQHKKDVTVIKYLTEKPYKREEAVETNEQ